MALENSPKLDVNGKTKPSFSGWLAEHRLWVILTFFASFLIGLLFLYLQLQPILNPPPPGGLEGCLVNGEGSAVSGSVRVGEISRPIYTDGCFFFPALPGGDQHLFLVLASGEQTIPVTVIADEMIDLGEIVVSP